MKLLVSLTLLSLLTVSCATKSEKQSVHEEAAASEVRDPKALGETIEHHIDVSKTLTDAQKAELHKIIDENKKKAMELQEKSFQFRSVLVKELLSGKISKKRIQIIKNDIKRIEQARLANTFEAIEQISRIVANQPDKDFYSNELMVPERAVK